MSDWEVAQTEDPFIAWHRRLETDALLAVVDRALSYVGDGCQECDDKRFVTSFEFVGLGYIVHDDIPCPECGG